MPTFRFHHMLSRNYIIFVVLLCSLASYLCYTLIASRASVDRRDSLVSKTYQVINIAEQTTALLEGMLAAQRGYILSGDERFLEKYDHKKSTVSEQLAQLTERSEERRVGKERE